MDDPNARSTDPFTSKDAGSNIRAEKKADSATVYRTIWGSHPLPIADFQLDEMMGGAQNGRWRKRRSDLTDDRLLMAVDTIINPATGKQVIRWGLYDDPQAPVPRPLSQLPWWQPWWKNAAQ